MYLKILFIGLFRMSRLWAADGWRGEERGDFLTFISYLKEIQKIYESCDIYLEFC